ncbi:hypothetical protein CDAR_378421 [Caerostris darwini]|uniref:Uncharacterized protein n=1 Tax=Caerostris darwini TaxID=1538125 RepID=A0AAV4T6R2_9ARAC|nr:hypothetical protein CDAR_378421 [Caerostris darwini]
MVSKWFELTQLGSPSELESKDSIFIQEKGIASSRSLSRLPAGRKNEDASSKYERKTQCDAIDVNLELFKRREKLPHHAYWLSGDCGKGWWKFPLLSGKERSGQWERCCGVERLMLI